MHAGAGRRDDVKTLRTGILLLIPKEDKLDVREFTLKKKSARGFNHHTFARLLCPRSMLDEFDSDPDRFALQSFVPLFYLMIMAA